MNIGVEIDKRNGVDSPIVDYGRSGTSSRAYQSEKTTTAGDYVIREAQNKWKGYGTCLKPSFEPIIMARKPVYNTILDNVIKYNVGGLNIDECRVGTEERTYKGMSKHKPEGAGTFRDDNWEPKDIEVSVNGRFPANTILTYDETDFDEVCGGFPDTQSHKRDSRYNKETEYTNTYTPVKSDYRDDNTYGDSGSASRYYYCAKASAKDRDDGLEAFTLQSTEDGYFKNSHPTVKPCELMQYLVRLVAPKGATILDPFMGSGSTGKAVMFEDIERNANYKFIGVEQEKLYCDIAEARIKYALGDRIIEKYDETTGKLGKVISRKPVIMNLF